MIQSLPYHTLAVLTAIIIGLSLSWTPLYDPLSSSALFVRQIVQSEKTLLDTHSNLKFALGSTMGLLRCTDGKLVNIQDQCPPQDECPPPQNVTVSSCTRGGISATLTQDNEENSTENSSNTELCRDDNRFTVHTSDCPKSLISSKNDTAVSEKKQGMIEIFTDKKNYKSEEVVHVNVKNTGNESLVFSDTKSDVLIRKLNGSQTYQPSTLGTLAVEPNGTKTFTWNQQNTIGQQVNKGIYSASINIGTLKANTTFNIS